MCPPPLAGHRYELVTGRFLPPALAHQIFAETDSEFVSAMPIGGMVKLPDGVVMDVPWRRQTAVQGNVRALWALAPNLARKWAVGPRT